MDRLARYGMGLLCLLLLAAGLWTVGYASGERDATRLVRYRDRTDTLRVEIQRLDTVYHTDTLRLWRLLRQVDTLVRVDSIPVLAADSARADTSLRVLYAGLRACATTVQTCEQRVAAERRLRVLAESALAAPGATPPRRTGRAFVTGALAGSAVVLFLRR